MQCVDHFTLSLLQAVSVQRLGPLVRSGHVPRNPVQIVPRFADIDTLPTRPGHGKCILDKVLYVGSGHTPEQKIVLKMGTIRGTQLNELRLLRHAFVAVLVAVERFH